MGKLKDKKYQALSFLQEDIDREKKEGRNSFILFFIIIFFSRGILKYFGFDFFYVKNQTIVDILSLWMTVLSIFLGFSLTALTSLSKSTYSQKLSEQKDSEDKSIDSLKRLLIYYGRQVSHILKCFVGIILFLLISKSLQIKDFSYPIWINNFHFIIHINLLLEILYALYVSYILELCYISLFHIRIIVPFTFSLIYREVKEEERRKPL